jgi:DNA-directed RNA polymerase beta subunit
MFNIQVQQNINTSKLPQLGTYEAKYIDEDYPDEENIVNIPHLGSYKIRGRYFYEPYQARRQIKNYVLHTLTKNFLNKPINLLNKYTLTISDITFGAEPKENTDVLIDALDNKKSLTVPLYAKIKIVENDTGNVVFNGKKLLAQIPYMTSQGYFILNGTKYVLVNQLRLKPGIYFRTKGNGLPEAIVNSLAAPRLTHRYVFDPNTLKMTVLIGQATVPAYVWLKFLGADDDEIRTALGDEIYLANKTSASSKLIWSKLKNRFLAYLDEPVENTSEDEKASQIVQKTIKEKLNLDPLVVEKILGYKASGVDKIIALDIMNKLVEMNRGVFKPLDRDDLAFKYVYGPEDLISESLASLPQRVMFYLRKLPYSTHKDFSKILPAGFMTKDVMNFFYNSGLGMNPDEYNPTELIDVFSKVTVMGRGGIASQEAVTVEARNIHPSYLGFIDPIRTPEKNVGTDMRFASSVVKRGRTIYALFKNLKNNRLEWKSPIDLVDKVVGFPESPYLPDEFVPAIKNRRLVLVKKDELDYALPSMYSMLNPTINLIPLNNASFAHRLSMGAKMTQQALPLVKGEAPLVQNAIKPNYGWADYFGKYAGAVFAEDDGVVESVTDKYLKVKYKNGETKEYPIWSMLPTNRETYYLQKPLVEKGQKIQKDQPLVVSNFTDDKGTLALGVNLRTGYLPYWGYTFEDAFVVSESAAKKLSSLYLLKESAVESDDFIIDKKRFLGLFPTKFTTQQLNKLDERGIVKPGTILNPGDPIILGFNDPTKSAFWVYGRAFRLKPADVSITWDKSYPGEVTKVVQNPKNKSIFVYIKATAPLQVGDKLSGLYGDKGVVSAVIPDELMPRDEEGKPFEIIENPFALFRRNPSLLLAGWFGMVAAKTGKPYYVDFSPEKYPDLYQKVQDEARKNGIKLTQTVYDPQINKNIPNVSVGNRYFYKLKFTSESKSSSRSFGGYSMDDVPVKGGEYGCLHPDTEIICRSEPNKCLAKFIDCNQSLLSFDFNKKTAEFQPVTDKFKYEIPNKKIFLEISTNLDQRVIVSKQHQFFTPDLQKIEAHQLKIGDKILTVRILPNRFQMDIVLTLLLIAGNKAFMDSQHVIVKLPVILPGSLIAHLNKTLKPYARIQVIKINRNFSDFNGLLDKSSKREKQICVVKLHPKTYFTKIVKNVISKKINNDINFTNKALSGFMSISLITALFGKVALNGSIIWELPKTFDEEIAEKLKSLLLNKHSCEVKLVKEAKTKPVGPYRRQKYETTEIIVGYKLSLLFDKEFSNYILAHCSRYFLGSDIRDQGLAYRLSNFIKNQPICIRNTLLSIFSAEDKSKLDKKEQNKTYLLEATITNIEHYKPSKDYESYMYDFTVKKNHNYITSDWIILSNSKRVGLLNTYGLLAHGATQVLRDMKLVKGQRNDVFWNNFVLGLPLPEPQVPLVYEKLISYLKGSGINIIDDNKAAYLTPLTQKDIDNLSKGRIIKSDKIIKIQNDRFTPERDGLFDEKLTGGLDGRLWSAIELPFPLPNPVVENQLIKLIGLTEGEYLGVLSGEKGIDGSGNLYDKSEFYKAQKIYTGPQGLYEFFKKFNVDAKISELKSKLKTEMNPDDKSRAVNSLIFLETLKQYNIQPDELFWTKFPVVPPIFRPSGVVKIGPKKERSALISDINVLYSDLIRTINNYNDLKGVVTDLKDEILAVHQAANAAIGLMPPVSRRAVQKNMSGLLKHVFGSQPKMSMMQYYLLSTPVDVVGRSVIVPDPNLKLDEVGLPEEVLWEVYRPFVIRRLVQKGIPKTTVLEQFENRTKIARDALLDEMSYRPVIIDRAPLLHKFGMLAFWPKITPGFVMRINPLVTAGFGADFDGDTMNYHVPVSETARQEAIEKMLPSKNVIQPLTYKAQPVPSKDFAAGIYIASKTKEKKNKTPKIYTDFDNLLKDIISNKIDMDDPVILSTYKPK